MDDDIVVVASLGQRYEVLACLVSLASCALIFREYPYFWSVVIVQLDDDRALRLGQLALPMSICPIRYTMVVSSATFVAMIEFSDPPDGTSNCQSDESCCF